MKVQIVFVQSYLTSALAIEEVSTVPRSATVTRSDTEVKFSSLLREADGRSCGFLMDAAFSALTAAFSKRSKIAEGGATWDGHWP